MKTIIALFALCVSGLIHAQTPTDLRRDKMKQILFLAGHWQGEGWMVVDGKKEHFTQIEVVTPKLDSSVLLVEGMGKLPGTGQTIHDAVALLTYDVGRKQYRWLSSTTRSGYLLDVEPQVSENKFIWMINASNGSQIRYTITLDKGDWLEIGERSTDAGKTWTQNFEMRLQKK